LCRSLRKAADFFEQIGSAQHFQTATWNRVGVTLIEKGDYKDALGELKEAALLADTIPDENSKNALLGANYRHQAVCQQHMGDVEASKEWFEKALVLATQVGDPDLVAELNDKLRIGDKSVQDQVEDGADGDVFL